MMKYSFSQILSVISLALLAIALPVGIALVAVPIKPIITPASSTAPPPQSPTPIVIGNSPVISTENLPSATVGRNYRARIEGYDLDTNEVLTFTATNVPSGLTLDKCRQNIRISRVENTKVKYLTCDFGGKTNENGVFEIVLILDDNNNKTVKYLNLQVLQ